MEKDKISIIVPIYNNEKYCSKCIKSIVDQTYRNIEILIIDDGSTDNSLKICKEYAQKDNRIKVIHKENGGLSTARNLGLDNVTGEYIAFIDSDDYIHPKMIERLHSALISTKADISVCNLKYVDEDGKKIKYYPNHIIKNEILDRNTVFVKSLEDFGYYYTIVWNKLYKKRLWSQYRFPIAKFHEDDFCFHHILEQCNKICCVEECFYYYVQHKGSIMAEPSIQKNLDAIEAMLDRLIYYKENNITPCIVKQDQNCFWCIKKCYQLFGFKENKEKYLEFRREYFNVHEWVKDHFDYPKIKEVQIKSFFVFPYIEIPLRLIKKLIKMIKYKIIN